MDEKWNVCLGEFGFEKVKAEFRTQSLDTANYVYRDPNIYKGDSLTAESDIYSFGILMWELWTTKTPFDGCNGIKVCFFPRDRESFQNQMEYVKIRLSFQDMGSSSNYWKGLNFFNYF